LSGGAGGARGPRRGPRAPRVFEHDPDLLAGLDPATARIARQRCVADSAIVDCGRWRPPTQARLGHGAIGLLVLDGLITRTVRPEGTESPELIGEGDLLRPWDVDPIEGSLDLQPEWRVLQRATVAILDERFARRACCAPAVVSALLSRTMRRSRGLAFQLAIAHLRNAEARVRLLFWHLAERWGRVTASRRGRPPGAHSRHGCQAGVHAPADRLGQAHAARPQRGADAPAGRHLA
jgi:CRP/FNR family transcriptional regulator, cyclic AMP receptor protein